MARVLLFNSNNIAVPDTAPDFLSGQIYLFFAMSKGLKYLMYFKGQHLAQRAQAVRRNRHGRKT